MNAFPAPFRAPHAESPRAIGWFAYFLVLHAVVWLNMPCGTFFSPDEGGKYLQLMGMGSHPLQPVRLVYPGLEKDPAMFYYPSRAELAVCSTRIYPYADAQGRVRTNWPPWFPCASKPFLAWLGHRGLYLIPLLAGFLALWLTGGMAAAIEPRARLLALAAFALSSPLLFYGLTFWEHAPALVLQLAALRCVWPRSLPREGGGGFCAGRLAAAGLLLVGAIALRREALFFAVALGGACVLQNGKSWFDRWARRRRLVWGFVLAGGLSLLAAGPWWLPGRTGMDLWLALYRVADPGTWLSLPTHFFDVFFLRNAGSPLPVVLRWIGQAGLLICLGNAFWSRARRPGVFLAGVLLVMPCALFMAFTPIRYRAFNSFVLSAPFVLFALLPSAADGERSAGERFVRTVAGLFAFLFLFATLPTHRGHGGLEWGSRYALVLFCLLSALGAVNVWRRWAAGSGRGWMRAGMGMLVALSLWTGLASMVRGVRELLATRRDLGGIQAALSAQPAPIVTDCWWMAASLTDLYARHGLYTLAAPEELRGWLDTVGRDVSSFVYASYEPLPAAVRFREKDRLEFAGREVVCGMGLETYRILSASERMRP